MLERTTDEHKFTAQHRVGRTYLHALCSVSGSLKIQCSRKRRAGTLPFHCMFCARSEAPGIVISLKVTKGLKKSKRFTENFPKEILSQESASLIPDDVVYPRSFAVSERLAENSHREFSLGKGNAFPDGWSDSSKKGFHRIV